MNEREFSTRVRACTQRLWRISWSILRCGADCDDALQETLLRAWQKIDGLREERFFETWLTRILINECKRTLKRRADGLKQISENRPEEACPENRELAEAIALLPLETRIPIVLHYMEGYSIREIAAMLRLPETTVKWRLHSGRKRLKEELNGEGATKHES